jgi:hypothetical protein
MECGEVQKQLSAYYEASLSFAEKAIIEEHLALCPKCSQSLADLKKAIEVVQGLPEVEPPAWLTQKVMAKVRSEPAPRRRIVEMLFYPIPIKLPLEAAGVIAIAVTTIFIFKAIQPEMHLSKTPWEEIRPPVVSEVPKAATPQQPVRKQAPEIGGDREAKQQSMKSEEQSAVRGEAEAPPPAPTPKPEPLRPMAELGAVKGEREPIKAPSPAVHDQEAMSKDSAQAPSTDFAQAPAPSTAPPGAPAKLKGPPPAIEPQAGTGAKEEPKHQVLSALPREEEGYRDKERDEWNRKALPAAPQVRAMAEKKEAGLRLTLAVKDRQAASTEIEKAIAKLGGRVLGKESVENKTVLTAELSFDRLEALLSKLKSVGEVKGKTADFEAQEGTVQVIRIEVSETK